MREMSSCPPLHHEHPGFFLAWTVQLVTCPTSLTAQQDRKSPLSCSHCQPNQDFYQHYYAAENLQHDGWKVFSLFSGMCLMKNILPALNFPFSPQIVTAFTEGSASALFSPSSSSWRTVKLKEIRDLVSNNQLHYNTDFLEG